MTAARASGRGWSAAAGRRSATRGGQEAGGPGARRMDRVERSGRRIAGEGGFAHRRQSSRRRATKAGLARGGADADCRSAPQRRACGRARLVPGTGLEPASQLRRRIFVTLLLSKPAPRGAVRALDYAFAVVRTRFDRVNLRRPPSSLYTFPATAASAVSGLGSALPRRVARQGFRRI
ncbi:hypothetical protein DF122_23515 [Burkholderia pseudomallei]|nr:hypothetical protein BOC35_36355 [Burkholderia pseudomallei]ARK51788.1 hypothetical protein BOC36_00170 [Burkholderia pseudomallei]ARK62784.1 hypothetical protein BOC37_23465 [Burkholderia pseudomallei]ARK65373.1 hypothetical protein BOC38_00400 [Burkholderia pseudomallei]ARK80751.1 hypothetical protein BOC40_10230 [Burkholderia pseudomallei]